MEQIRTLRTIARAAMLIFAAALFAPGVFAQNPASAKAELGSRTAKGGFRNEDDIRDKFNLWQTDTDAQNWLAAMGFSPGEIRKLVAAKPHGDKADVVVLVETAAGNRREGISIKLVSSPNGFNQVDKRWLGQYARLWKMPPAVISALKKFVGEEKPPPGTRQPDRMFLNELTADEQAAVIEFFSANKQRIVADVIRGEGLNRADWFMVAWKTGDRPKWKIIRAIDAIDFFSQGKVEITRSGNLRLGKITMQRKGGDAGRPTAQMLQFKLNPALIFNN